MKKNIFLVSLLLLWAFLPAIAQVKFEAKPQKSQILIGEPLIISLEITGATEAKAEIPDSLGRFEVLEIKEPVNTPTSTFQQIVVTCFDSGTFRLPPIGLNDGSGIYSPGFDLEVGTLPADSLQHFGDLKQISGMMPAKQWPYWLAITAAALLAIGFLLWLYRKRKVAPGNNLLDKEEPAMDNNQLLALITQLETDWRNNSTSSEALGNRLMFIFSKHLTAKGLYTLSKTGEEIILLSKTWYDSNSWQNLAQSIRLCNAMRFGKYQASIGQGLEGIGHFKKCILISQQADEWAAANQPVKGHSDFKGLSK